MIYTHRESVSEYVFIVCIFSAEYRLAECRENHQWIVQRNTGHRWRSERFFRTKVALVRYVGSLGLAADALEKLPNNFESQFGFGQGMEETLPSGYPDDKMQGDSDHGYSGCTEGL